MAEHVKGLLSAYLDQELNESERHQVERHLNGCLECRRELEAFEMLQTQIAFAYESIEVPSGFEENLAENIEKQQRKQSGIQKWTLAFVGALLVAAILLELAPVLSLGAAMTTFVVHTGYDLLKIVPFLVSSLPYMLGAVCMVAVLLIVLSLWSLRRLLEARSLS